MTAQCMGNFGAHKWRYPEFVAERYGRSNRSPEPENQPKQDDVAIQGVSDQTVWVNKRYIPTDLRSTAPVPRHKLLAPRRLPQAERHWVPLGEASLRQFSRAMEERELYVSQPSTRSEDWSTLRQILPSKGLPLRHSPPNWGTGSAYAPPMIGARQRRFPHINSPMTRYVDDMHTTHKLFKLH
ncbi:uncharacterized protein LOC121418774 [Lytechinus variegatus]|uniref:uncharacterized protein LOC121418774 n=1 Tax=Lytechinus variegatus TaxID=7654 RepID=UPI001BB2A6FA|nr:uncharacterized protein LOC121418774 [Lytechinus variegatus]